MIKRISLILFFLFYVICTTYSQTIAITSPTVDMNFKEGDDFFTTVMNNPLDFNERRDFMWEDFFDDNTINDTPNGVWEGTTTATGAHMYPLYQGFSNNYNAGLHGDNYPLDGSKYTLFSSSSKVSARSSKILIWTNEVKAMNFADPAFNRARTEIYFTPTKAMCYGENAGQIDTFDLSTEPQWMGKMVRGIALQPSNLAPAGSTFKYDWIRICDPNSAPKLTITWTTNGAPPNSSMGLPRQVHVYLDDNNSGNDGNLIARVKYTYGTYELPTAMLPPGDHYFYVTLQDNTVTDQNCNGGTPCSNNNCIEPVVATSPYSAKITINAKPKITFTSPSFTSGEDYATTVLGNPWDMNDDLDIINEDTVAALRHFINPSFSGGVFSATATSTPGDSQIYLKVDQDNPISTSKYRYATFEMMVDETGYSTINQKVRDGWVTRYFWWEDDIANDGSSSFHTHLYEGRRSYTFDLHADKRTIVDSTNTGLANTGWLGNPFSKVFRLDPLENIFNTKFFLYDVKLTAIPKFENNIFTVAYTTQDKENETGTVELFYDTDNIGFNGISLGSTNVTFGGNHEFSINAASIPKGDFYIYGKVTDAAGNVHQWYSDAPVSNGTNLCSTDDPLVIPGNLIGTYRGINVKSSGTLTNSKSASIFASNSILLENGFFVDVSSNLSATIKSCEDFLTEDAPVEFSKLTNPSNITPITKEIQLKTYPNPVTSNATIEYFLPEESDIEISIVNLMGQPIEIIQQNSKQNSGYHRLSYSSANLENGTYFVMLKNKQEIKLEKLLILKN